jgi:hypothetical protein
MKPGKYGGLLGTKVVTGMSFDPTDGKSVLGHLRESTKFNLLDGIMRRKNQAITKPDEYLEDKLSLWNALIAGSDGTSANFKVKLPGATTAVIPPMPSLIDEWQTTYTALVAAGIPNDTAALQTDGYCNSIFNQRIKMFDTAFPGLVDDAYQVSLSNKVAENNAKALSTGLVDVPSSSTYKFEKYRKRAKKYKAKKRATKST